MKSLGITRLARESLMWIPLPTGERRIDSNDNLKLGTTNNHSFTPQDPLRTAPTGKSPPLTAGGREARCAQPAVIIGWTHTATESNIPKNRDVQAIRDLA